VRTKGAAAAAACACVCVCVCECVCVLTCSVGKPHIYSPLSCFARTFPLRNTRFGCPFGVCFTPGNVLRIEALIRSSLKSAMSAGLLLSGWREIWELLLLSVTRLPPILMVTLTGFLATCKDISFISTAARSAAFFAFC